jgi:hypothetical protein
MPVPLPAIDKPLIRFCILADVGHAAGLDATQRYWVSLVLAALGAETLSFDDYRVLASKVCAAVAEATEGIR